MELAEQTEQHLQQPLGVRAHLPALAFDNYAETGALRERLHQLSGVVGNGGEAQRFHLGLPLSPSHARKAEQDVRQPLHPLALGEDVVHHTVSQVWIFIPTGGQQLRGTQDDREWCPELMGGVREKTLLIGLQLVSFREVLQDQQHLVFFKPIQAIQPDLQKSLATTRAGLYYLPGPAAPIHRIPQAEIVARVR